MRLQDLDDTVAGKEVGNDDTVELAAVRAVVVFEPGCLFAHDQVVSDRADQFAVRDRILIVVHDDRLGFHGILDVEGRLLHHGQKRDLGSLDSEYPKLFDQIADDLFLLFQRRIDEERHVGDRHQAVLTRHCENDGVGQKAVFLDQVVRLVQHGEQQIPGLCVAAHQAVGIAGQDHLNGVLHRVRVIGDRLEIKILIRVAEIG